MTSRVRRVTVARVGRANTGESTRRDILVPVALTPAINDMLFWNGGTLG